MQMIDCVNVKCVIVVEIIKLFINLPRSIQYLVLNILDGLANTLKILDILWYGITYN